MRTSSWQGSNYCEGGVNSVNIDIGVGCRASGCLSDGCQTFYLSIGVEKHVLILNQTQICKVIHIGAASWLVDMAAVGGCLWLLMATAIVMVKNIEFIENEEKCAFWRTFVRHHCTYDR